MASFDVQSLFTNIPLNEIINLYSEQCTRDKLVSHALSVLQFKSITVKDFTFVFNKLYK